MLLTDGASRRVPPLNAASIADVAHPVQCVGGKVTGAGSWAGTKQTSPPSLLANRDKSETPSLYFVKHPVVSVVSGLLFLTPEGYL